MLRTFILVNILLFYSCSNESKSSIDEINEYETKNFELNFIENNVIEFLNYTNINFEKNTKIIIWGSNDCIPCMKETYFSKIKEFKGNTKMITSNTKLKKEIVGSFKNLIVITVKKEELKHFSLDFSRPILIYKTNNLDIEVTDL